MTTCESNGAKEGGEVQRWHELKTDPDVFDAVAAGRKTHEIRFNDRNFKVGDGLLLKRTRNTGWAMKNTGAPLEYTGEEFRAVVTHITDNYGLTPDWVVLSIKPYERSAGGKVEAPSSNAGVPPCDPAQRQEGT